MKNIIPLTALSLFLSPVALACTTIAWDTDYGVISTRTFDWLEQSRPALETFYKGEERQLNNQETYKVNHNFIAITSYDNIVAEGVNEHKLHINTLYYSPQTTVKGVDGSPEINQFTLGEYILSQFESVADVVKNINKLTMNLEESDVLPVAPTLHYSLTDPTGDRIIIEHDADGVKIYRGEKHAVMTNQPSISVHESNWADNEKLDFNKIDGYTEYGNKGRINAEDRYLHGKYFFNQLEKPTSARNAMIKLASVAYKVPHDANNREVNGNMTGYATEYQVTIDVTNGATVFQYQWGDTWAHHEWNMYDVLNKNEKVQIRLDNQSAQI